jgi:hypothetical protein
VGRRGVLDPHRTLGHAARPRADRSGDRDRGRHLRPCHRPVRQVIARGRAEILPFDVARGRRKLSRYLGEDETRWDRRFRHYLLDDPAEKGTVWLRLRPDSLVASDLSYSV